MSKRQQKKQQRKISAQLKSRHNLTAYQKHYLEVAMKCKRIVMYPRVQRSRRFDSLTIECGK